MKNNSTLSPLYFFGNIKLTLFILFFNIITAQGQKTLIPDKNFERALIRLGYDAGVPDGSVPTENIVKVKKLRLVFRGITRLVGIQDFEALEELDCSFNRLNGILDLKGNTALIKLRCVFSSLRGLDVSNSVNLKELYCEMNDLLELDVSKNTKLEILDVHNNDLTNLYLGKNTALKNLTCSYNKLTSLEVNNNSELTTLYCYNNKLTNLNVRENTKLTDLKCNINRLESLDVTSNVLLETFFCGNNQLSSIDVTQNTKLIKLRCQVNNLNTLDVTRNLLLTDLRCSDNKLKSLILSNNLNLIRLRCSDNELDNLNLTNNRQLELLACANNNFTDLDLSRNVNLNIFYFINNKRLTTLNLRNGNNRKIGFIYGKKNPNLNCVLVDDVAYSSRWASRFDKEAKFVTRRDQCAVSQPVISAVDVGNITIRKSRIEGDRHLLTVNSTKLINRIAVQDRFYRTHFYLQEKKKTYNITLSEDIYFVKIEIDGKIVVRKIALWDDILY